MGFISEFAQQKAKAAAAFPGSRDGARLWREVFGVTFSSLFSTKAFSSGGIQRLLYRPSEPDPSPKNVSGNVSFFGPSADRFGLTKISDRLSTILIVSAGSVDWCSKNLFSRPPFIRSLLQSLEGHPKSVRPILEAKGFSFPSEEPVLSCISILFFSGYPTTIARLIPKTIVNSFKHVFGRWFRSHIGQESPETVVPVFIYSDSSASVIFPVRSIGVVASCFHVIPSSVFCWEKAAQSVSWRVVTGQVISFLEKVFLLILPNTLPQVNPEVN